MLKSGEWNLTVLCETYISLIWLHHFTFYFVSVFFTVIRIKRDRHSRVRSDTKSSSLWYKVLIIQCPSSNSSLVKNKKYKRRDLCSSMDENKIYLRKSATNLTSAMTILGSIIMCFRSLSCSTTGKCSSQKIQGTDGEPSKLVVPPGLSGRESGSRI